MLEKLKLFLKDDQIYYSILVLLIGILSFFLGRMSADEISSLKNLLPNQNQGSVIVSTPAENQADIYMVASKNGSKYHLPWCPGASQIKDANQVRFENKADAEGQGYTPAANCPGI